MKIAISGKKRHGKDLCCMLIQASHGGHIVRFSEPLYDIMYNMQSALQQPVEKDGPLLQRLGTTLKLHYGDDVFARCMEKKLDTLCGNVLIADLRFLVEAKMLRAAGFKLIRINRPNAPKDNRDENDRSEIELDDYDDFDAIIENNGTIEELKDKLLAVISKW